jgi:hypothetical protein
MDDFVKVLVGLNPAKGVGMEAERNTGTAVVDNGPGS